MNPITNLDSMIEDELPSLVDCYKKLHAAPELSHFEEKTSKVVANELKSLGYDVSENIGKFARPEWKGYGVVGAMTNGDGPTLLVRADMDALPIEEKTGLPYASRVTATNETGQQVGVMHACGHDIHVTCLLGTARLMAKCTSEWKGTLMLVAQPAEETVDGAKAMIEDGLYQRFPVPDFALALHTNAELEAGKVGYTTGYFLASLNSVDITVRGVGGHGSMPEKTKDPIVIAAQIVLALQTIVSREISPLEPAVVSVGSIHGGSRYNIIPDEVHLQVTIRAYSDAVRKQILNSLERICNGVALAAGVPADRFPVIRVSETEYTPASYNDPELSPRIGETFRKTLGEKNVVDLPPLMGSEDFGRFGLDRHQIPTFMFFVGAVDPVCVSESRNGGPTLPPLHSSHYSPLPEPTIRTGVKAMSSAILDLMKK